MARYLVYVRDKLRLDPEIEKINIPAAMKASSFSENQASFFSHMFFRTPFHGGGSRTETNLPPHIDQWYAASDLHQYVRDRAVENYDAGTPIDGGRQMYVRLASGNPEEIFGQTRSSRDKDETVAEVVEQPADAIDEESNANRLHDKVKSLIQNSEQLDEAKARIIVESADDAIKEFGSTNQEKKVELRKWKAQAELVLPPGTIEELRKRAEGELLKKAYPRNVILRNILLTIVILAVIIGGALALRQALSGSSEVRPTPSLVQEPVVKFVPLDDKEALIRSFKVKGRGDPVRLSFLSKNLDLAFDFTAPLDTKCDSLLLQILDHFSLRDHVQVDVRAFPTGISGGFWYPDWKLVLKGQEVGRNYEGLDRSLRDFAAADGDRIGIKLKWNMAATVSSNSGSPTGEKAKPPPDLDF
ncbi:MAG TPA: hypothetical protein VHE60_16335 [Pyrinomonadaceae bacterium]|nr:hypothetical protein [Pyrinomonadaceae bacterium]